MNNALKLPGASNAWTMPVKARIDMLSTGIRTPVGVKIYGSDLKLMHEKLEEVKTIINDYISSELVRDQELLPLTDDTSLLESGILDSLSLLQLVVFLEERFGITVGDADLLPENFASVNTICAYLRAREPEKQAAHG